MSGPTKDEMVEACKEAIRGELGSFFIEREQHFADHQFIQNVRQKTDDITSTACKVVTKGSLIGLGVLIGYGFIEWLKKMGVNIANLARYL